MTEADWLECTDPNPMLKFLQGRVSERKLRLFACSCCRRIWHYHLETGEEHIAWASAVRNAVLIGERYADGQATKKQLSAAALCSGSGEEAAYAFIACAGSAEDLMEVPDSAVNAAGELACLEAKGRPSRNRESVQRAAVRAEKDEKAAQVGLLREIVANPFYKLSLDLDPRTPTVLTLAQAAYEQRTLPAGTLDPDRLGVLADALEDAGCTEAAILEHLRGPGPHYRGCWALDLVLNRS
jgi:hypothetical protein